MKRPIIAIVLALAANAVAANATDSICKAVALRDSPETENFPYVLRRGETIDAVTQYRVNKKTNVAALSSHGGGCYPADALRLTNCRIDKSKPDFDDGDELYFSLELIRSKVPPGVLRQNDVELKLLDLGLCNACADNAAAFYVKMPNSRCARLVRGALEGNPIALKTLKEMPDYCME